MKVFAIVVLAALAVTFTSASPTAKGLKLTPGEYNTNAGPVPGKLNVHIVPHTHDDVGWLKTVDEYYMGLNNSIQNAGVQYILDSVTTGLMNNPDRKFIYVEIAFFKRWWDQQTTTKKNQVKALVHNGQLQFMNGGWCMSDEAAPYYVDMVDQQTLGHQFLIKEFGTDAIPNAGWQIDPFGHSNTMGTLYAMMGMNSWFFGRIDYQDRSVREASKNTETIMRPSASLGDQVNIFAGVMRGYGPPSGFNWDVFSSDEPMQDDERLEDVNIQSRVNDFVNAALDQNKVYRTDNIMFTMGSDFQYNNADTWFKNLDKLIHYVNLDGRVNAFYSNPSIYTESKYKANVTWTHKDDDFFPYADSPHAFWTGYFTSRPALKGYVRSNSNYLQACRQMELQVPTAGSSSLLWEAMGLAQHHDAVSGTEKQHVAFDYARHLSEGAASCEKLMNNAFEHLLKENVTFTRCLFLNESVCEYTTDIRGSSQVVVYNARAHTVNEYIRLPISSSQTVTVKGKDGAVASSVVVDPSTSKSTLVFKAQLPPAGFAVYTLTGQAEDVFGKEQARVKRDVKEEIVVDNSFYKMVFSNGYLQSITDKTSGQSTLMSNTWHWYNASTGNTSPHDNRGQASGAYIFRPNCTEDVPTPCMPWNVSTSATVSVTGSGAVQEVHQKVSNWVSQIYRLYEDKPYIEVEYTVGPIPFQDGLGREVISLWQSDMHTKQTFYTDSNGRDMQKRVINYRPTWKLNVTDPVSGNFYPVNSVLSMQEESGRRFTILTDRSQAGASLADGQLQLMAHRRLLHDDGRGVGEPLNETGIAGDGLIITGIYRLVLDTTSSSMQNVKDTEQSLTFPPLMAFARGDAAPPTVYSSMPTDLPANVHLLTTADNSLYGKPGSMLFRLAHLYETGQDAVMSKPASVNLGSIFSTVKITGCVEMSLTANQQLSSMNRYQWTTDTSPRPVARGAYNPATMDLVINPMEIRTFSCDYTTKV